MGCYNQDILFIHIPKCGGWSCKLYLRDNVPGILMPDDPRSKLPIGHVRLADIERFTGRTPDSFKLILAVVRDPYEREISQACFWATRYLQGARHIHDVVTWQHVRQDGRVMPDLVQAALTGERFTWGPGHIDMEGFILDRRTQFHVWYEQHVSPGPPPETGKQYEDFGGFYHYWLEADGVIPANVRVVRQEELATEFPALVEPYLRNWQAEPMKHLNSSAHIGHPLLWYTGLACEVVRQRYPWAFKNYYDNPRTH